jgi:hypothetical protein
VQTSQPKAERKRTRAEWLIFLLLLLAAIIIGFLISQSGLINNVFGSGGGGGGSRGSGSNQRAIAGRVSTGIGNTPQGLKAGDVKIAISDNGTYGFVTVGANDLMPGDTLARGFTIQNDGTSPIRSISLKASTSGSPVMLSNMYVTIERCSSSSCQPIINHVLLANLGPASNVIYSGHMLPGQTASYVVHTSMASSTPNSAEGQLAQVSYSLVAVGA